MSAGRRMQIAACGSACIGPEGREAAVRSGLLEGPGGRDPADTGIHKSCELQVHMDRKECDGYISGFQHKVEGRGPGTQDGRAGARDPVNKTDAYAVSGGNVQRRAHRNGASLYVRNVPFNSCMRIWRWDHAIRSGAIRFRGGGPTKMEASCSPPQGWVGECGEWRWQSAVVR